MASDHISLFNQFNQITLEYLTTKDNKYHKNIHTLLAAISKLHESVFSPGRIETCAFYNNIFNLLNNELSWPAIVVLHQAAKNKESRYTFIHTYNFLPFLTKFLLNLENVEEKIQIMSLMEELTYGISINWQESYLSSLLKFLSERILLLGNSEEKDPKSLHILSLSITIVVNLCSKNIPIMNLLCKECNVKDLFKCLLENKENEYFNIQLFRLLVAFQDIQGTMNHLNMENFIKISLQKFIKNIKSGNDNILRQCNIFMEEVYNDVRVKPFMQNFNKYNEAVEEILKTLPLLFSYTNNNEADLKTNVILKQTLSLLLKILKIGLYSMRPLYPFVTEVAIKSIDIQDCTENALKLLTTIINLYSDDGMLPDNVMSIINSETSTKLLFSPSSKLTQFQNEWFKFILTFSEFTKDFVIAHLRVTPFEELLSDILNKALLNDSFASVNTQETVLLGCKICLNLSETNSEWHHSLQKLLTNNLMEKTLRNSVNSPDNLIKRITMEIIKHNSFPANKFNLLFPTNELKPAPENNFIFQNNSTLNIAEEDSLNRLIRNFENQSNHNQTENSTASTIVELYKYKNMCLEQRLMVALASSENASKHVAMLNSTLELLNLTNNRQSDLLYTTQAEKESLQSQITHLTNQVKDGEVAIRKFSGKLAAEKISKDQQIANSSKDFMQKIKEMEEAIENKDKEISSINAKLNEQITKNNNLAQVLVKFEEKVKQKDAKLESTTNVLGNTKNDLNQASLTIKTLEKTISERDKRLTQVTTQLEEMQRVQDMIANLMGNKINNSNSNTSN